MSFRSSAVSYESRPFADISPEDISVWKKIVLAHKKFRNPFFSYGYSALVSSCNPNVRVGLIRSRDTLVGVFPHELVSIKHARPVGSVFCDYQGVIANPDAQWSAAELLTELNIQTFQFDHMLASQTQWEAFSNKHDVSWAINLSDGFDVYAHTMRQTNRRIIEDAKRKSRLIEREVGQLSFASHEVNHQLLDLLLDWKSNQWARSGWPGRFKSEWELKLMHRLLETKQHDFGGMFSILRCNGYPIALHLGMRSTATWHYWTTGYDPNFRRYSPGILLLVEMLKSAQNLGITEVDLGKEDFLYKKRFHTHTVPLTEGCAHLE